MVTFDANDPILSNIVAAFGERLRAPLDLTVAIDPTLGRFTGKWAGGVASAGSYGQMYDLLGRLLRNPSLAEGEYTSKKEIAGMYFATHFNNYPDSAPLPELFRYMEDLAFWGMNAFDLWFDMHLFRNPAEGRVKIERLTAMLKHAKKMGIPTVLTTLSNEAWNDSEPSLRADWTPGHDGYIHPLNDHFHLEICPSKPGGMELIKRYRREMHESIMEHYLGLKLQSAIQLMTTSDMTFTEIAELLGFSSVNYFSKFFKARTGLTPSEYGKENGLR